VRAGVSGACLAAAAAAAGALCVPTADAKGPDRATVCGVTHCVSIHGERAVWSLLAWQYDGPFAVRPAPRPAPFYAIRVRDSTRLDWTIVYVPRRHAVRLWQSHVPPYRQGVGPYWRTLPASAETVFARVVAPLAPRGAPRSWRLVPRVP
jgi:hypothetical protein